MKKLHYSIIIAMSLLYCDLYGQGCSDAGFCTINSLKESNATHSDNDYKNLAEAGIAFGKGDNNISITNPYLEYTRVLGEKWSVNTKIVYLTAKGELSTQKGFSDVFISPSYKVSERLKLIFGIKIPLSDGNNLTNDLPLPMGYQPSLGTTDIIGGVSYSLNNFGSMLAIQQPVTQNKNEFLTSLYPSNSEAHNYQSTNNYNRKGDALFRLTYSFITRQNKLSITPGLLFIYHLANDSYTNESGNNIIIQDSRGLTLNGTLILEYKLNDRNKIEFSLGTPFIVREVRPDGLTRKYVAGLEYKVLF